MAPKGKEVTKRKKFKKKAAKRKKGTKKIFSLQIFISIFKTEKRNTCSKAKEDNSIIIHQLLYPWIHS